MARKPHSRLITRYIPRVSILDTMLWNLKKNYAVKFTRLDYPATSNSGPSRMQVDLYKDDKLILTTRSSDATRGLYEIVEMYEQQYEKLEGGIDLS